MNDADRPRLALPWWVYLLGVILVGLVVLRILRFLLGIAFQLALVVVLGAVAVALIRRLASRRR
ncbi:MAG: hypothetical protein ACKVWR_11530 [Acidimicrobiales bacterium]